MKRPVLAHILALLATFAIVIATTAAWIVHLRLGPPLGGWVAGPMIIFVPLGILVLVAMWFTIRLATQRQVRWTALTVFAASFGMSLVIAAGYCGPIACFTPGNNRLMGWFLAGGASLAALAHHLVLNAFSGERSHALET